ncbi:MAG: radical SAM protein [Bacilli bacterium]
MNDMKYIYGPIPSRRLGLSLGISPIPKKYCNYSCIYCQLGRTNHMVNKREMFYSVDEIISELVITLSNNIKFDVVSIVGSGEPTLYKGIGELINKIKKICNKPVVVITNGALLDDKQVQEDLLNCDIILPTIDAYDENSFRLINRPHKKLVFQNIINGIIEFSNIFKGEIWLEIMFMENINDDQISLEEYKKLLKKIKYNKLYLNTPIRPPAEKGVNPVSHKKMEEIAKYLKGIPIDLPNSIGFHSEIKDDYLAVLRIIQRHPMNQFELESFLKTRKCIRIDNIFEQLNIDKNIEVIEYKGYKTYRLKI